MKKLIFIFCLIALSAANVEARPHGWPHHGFGRPPVHFAPYRHHHHGHDVAAGFAAGIIGGSLISYLTSGHTQTITSTPSVYSTTVYNTPATYTAPAVYSAPAVVSTQVVSPTYQNCYTNTNIITGATSTHCTGIPMTTQVITAN